MYIYTPYQMLLPGLPVSSHSLHLISVSPFIDSMKLGNHAPIPHPIDLQHKPEPRTAHDHLERKIQIVKLHTACRRQPREQALGHGAEVRGQRAHVDEVAGVGGGRRVLFAGDQVVGHDEGLAGTEVAGVVEGDGG